MSEKLQRARGTRDFMGDESRAFRFVESTAWSLAEKFGYEEIETPIFEFSEVFHRTLGETSDVISKETYTFTDRGGESLTLRPEGTAGVARAFISEGLAQNLPLKLYYSGPMFRYERPQKGRYRQFNQLGVECLGLDTCIADLECLSLAAQFLNRLGLQGRYQLEINTLGDAESRQSYRDALVEYFSQYKEQLSADSKVRLEKNPLRILDSKDEGDKKLVAQAPQMQNYLNETSQKFFADIQAGLREMGIDFVVNPRLVRGLDYYCHTVFELTTTELGSQSAILSGGRYDGLIASMGGPQTPGVGWAAGIERLMELTNSQLFQQSLPLVALIGADERGERACLQLAQKIRQGAVRAEVILGGNVGKKMKKANKLAAKYALIIGESELASQTVALKNMGTGEQQSLAFDALSSFAW